MRFCKKFILFILILILISLSIYSISKNSESSNPNDGVFVITMIDSDKSNQTDQNKRYFLHRGGEYLDPNLLLELVKSTIKDFDINLKDILTTDKGRKVIDAILNYTSLVTTKANIDKNALKKSEHLPNYANKVNKDNINIK